MCVCVCVLAFFLQVPNMFMPCAEGWANHQIWDKKDFFLWSQMFWVVVFLCTVHFGFFPKAFVYFAVGNFHGRDLEHSSVSKVSLPASCGTCFSVSSRTSAPKIKELIKALQGVRRHFVAHGVHACVQSMNWVLLVCHLRWPWLLAAWLRDLGNSFSSLRGHMATNMREIINPTQTILLIFA